MRRPPVQKAAETSLTLVTQHIWMSRSDRTISTQKRAKRLFCSPEISDQLWGPPAYWGPYTRQQSAQSVGLTNHLLLVPGFRMSGAITPLFLYDLME